MSDLAALRAKQREILSELLRHNLQALTPINVRLWKAYDESIDAMIEQAKYEAIQETQHR